ncbi:DUF3110 domain-containing protein [Kamptonema formosum]|uniref:DUF3110 domain-containing protein n=1 Tax=Kamptonema formosum TaxID=331992 RepID=UPI00034C1B88|nr:DUF3110 domain-containing protein [Oscillatoria sp. PCC 10802]
MRVFVLLFNARTENEGIHTLKDLRTERNKVLMFESEDDATRYALMLEAQDFPTATVEAVEDSEVKEFCSDCDYDWELVATGGLALPPENNVDRTDWQAEKSEEPEMSDSELERIRRKLEGLL